MGVRSWFRRWPGRRPARTITRRPLPLALQRLEDRDVPAVVGYYDMSLGQGNPTQVAPITAAGQTAKLLTDLTPADLAGVNVLFVQNPNNTGYGAEYLSRLASVQDAVAAGMTLLIQDRDVTGAASILPGGSGIGFVRETASNIDVIDDTTLVTHGPAGTITSTNLDGASFSDHGYALAATLPAGARAILSTGDHTHIVDFSYRYGAGNVIYSSIPLDFFLSTKTNFPAFGSVYAPNVVAYAADLLNVPPSASPGTLTTNEDTPAAGRLVASDANGDPLTYSLAGGPLHGAVTITGPNTGDYTYTPAPNFNGTDSFVFRVADGRGGTGTATVTITVIPVNDPPVAAADNVVTAEDTPVSIAVLANDTDVDGDHLTVTDYTQAGHGTVGLNADGTFSYTPAPNYNGPDSFTYTISDGHGGTAVGTVSVSVTPVNDPPTVSPMPDTTADEGSPVAFSAAADDVDGDPLSYSWDFGDGGTGTGPDVTHTYDHSGVYTVVLTVDDGQGGVTTGTLTVTILDVAPAVSTDTGPVINEGSSFAGGGSFADPGADTWTATVDYGDGSGVQPLALNPDRSFALDHTYADDGVYTVAIQVNDGDGGIGTATVTVTVLNVAPTVTAGPDGTVNEGSPFAATGSFADPGADTWTATVDYGDGSGPQPLALNPDNTFALSHTYAVGGVYTVTVSVDDGDGGVGTTTVAATVLNVAPTVAISPAATVIDEGSPFAAGGSFTDPGAESWTATVDYGDGSGPQPLAVNPDKTFALAHTYADDGIYTVVVSVDDGAGGIGTATLAVTVRNVAPTVTAGPDGTVNEGSPFAGGGSFADPGADTWTATVDYGDGSGVQPLALNPDKTFALLHTYADDGVYTITVRVDDGDGGVGTATVAATVLNVAPTASAGPDRTANEGDTVVLTGTFTDPGTADAHTLTWSVADPTGKVVATGTGPSVSFVPPDNGVYTGTFTVTDDDGGVGTATVRVTVLNVAPTVAISGPGTVGTPKTAAFTATVIDPGSADTFTITWKVADDHGRVVATGTGPQFTFNPKGPGDYTITCTVTDDDGGVGTAAQHLSVVPQGQLPVAVVNTLAILAPDGDKDKGKGLGALIHDIGVAIQDLIHELTHQDDHHGH